jgi:tRNA A-37 threonylcarbamoyl transferase component Bud32/tetratricopeptide (TPR) repeat protein
MNAERWREVTALFDKAIGLPPVHRDAFLVSACGTDTELLAEVRSLLDVHTDDPEYLEASAWAHHGGVIEEAIENQNVEERVGNYRLLRKIGSGGMGSVYLAERDDDAFRKQVAIKFIRGGALRENAIKRFRRERQILARLEHPGIARLLDGGTTSRGTPYFVMEYVEGRLLLDYCDEMGMGVRSRIELFLKVCEAVEYAHERLIVHRDLKASNILVNADGQPKLLDFGIAKVLEPDEGGQLTLTQTGLRQFTPDYASPEQIRGDQVTTATDVYSLGVLLYEMLTGRRPFRFQSASPVELLNVLLESAPVKPSSAVTKTEEISGKTLRPEMVIWHRRTDLRTLVRALSGDLDNIVLKALAKQPAERYGTAVALANDLRAYLEGHIVTAQKATAGYRLVKFLGRNVWQVSAGAAVVVSLLAGLLLTTWQWRTARAERFRAEMHSRQSRQMARSLIFELHEALVAVPGTMAARALLLARSTQFLDELSAASGDDTELQVELAEAYRKLAAVQGDMRSENLGQRKESLQSYEKGLALAQRAVVDARFRERAEAIILDLMGDQMIALEDMGDREKTALVAFELTKLLNAAPPRDAGPSLMASRALAWRQIGANHVQNRRNEEGRAAYLKSKELYESLMAEAQRPAQIPAQYAFTLKRLGALAIAEKRFPEAGEHYTKALGIERELLREQPGDRTLRFGLTYTLSDLGYLQRENGKLDEALKLYREALQLREAALAEDPNNERARWGVASTLNYLGDLYGQLAWYPQGREAYERALTLREDMLARTPESRSNEFAVAQSRAGLAELLAGEAQAALRGSQRTVALQRARNLARQALAVYEERAQRKELIGSDTSKPAELGSLLQRIEQM